MAVRKFLDENGAAKLNELLANKFNSKLDCTELTSSVRIWDLDDGVYKLPTGCVVYYYGATNTSNTFTISTTGWLFVTHYSTTYKFYYILCADNLATRYLYNGYVTSTDGSSKNFNLGSTYLTKISSYVKNNLTYSTSNTTYALSAYQGYLLNQNKADKTEVPTKTSDLINDSGFGDVSNKQNQVTYSTTDITAGSTTLATGDLYIVYE